MKNSKKICMALGICASALALTMATGCKGVDYVKFSNTIPGEYNFSGVSKIALVDFNTIPDDPVNGTYSVDAETKQIVEDMVASQFFKGKTYKFARLNVEKDIFSTNGINSKLAQRFDAIIYGRVWWKKSDEYKNIHPVVYTLEKWRKEKYIAGRDDDGRPYYNTAHLTETMTDVKADHMYRASNATLMLSLTVYRLGRNGTIEKIVEDFSAADQDYLLDNGTFSTVVDMHEKVKLSKFERIAAKSINKDAEAARVAREKAGFIDKERNANTIPTALQTKIMLGKKITDTLGKKMTNTEVPVEAEFFGKYCFFAPIEENLLNLIIAGKFATARSLLVTEIRKKAGYSICDRIGSLSAYEKEKVEVAKDPDCFAKLKAATTDKEKAEIEEEIAELVEDTIDDFENELYALAICEEACGKYDYALETYRALLKVSAEDEYALGISRCLTSMDMAYRLQKVAKDAKKANAKASLR